MGETLNKFATKMPANIKMDVSQSLYLYALIFLTFSPLHWNFDWWMWMLGIVAGLYVALQAGVAAFILNKKSYEISHCVHADRLLLYAMLITAFGPLNWSYSAWLWVLFIGLEVLGIFLFVWFSFLAIKIKIQKAKVRSVMSGLN